ncbi:hypothetical protein G210_5389 [Candida maltosa Xu316]|uniref:C2H2-type domain-containing protein n=1 Tax=Candida maltosa (strain Xu316) TaxID=1245528 RepID=M3K3C1_CANMX|nr:hypothetical protein G210_5389 [Candida maltosa Xu316]
MSQDFPPLFESNSFFNNPMLNGNNPVLNGYNATTSTNNNNNTTNANTNDNNQIDSISFPESFHLNDEIFFNNYQFNPNIQADNVMIQQQQLQLQLQLQLQQSQNLANNHNTYIDSASTTHSFDSELISNMSSNSLNTYFTNPNTASSSSSSSFSSGSANNQNVVATTNTTPKIPNTPQQFVKHGRQNSTSIPVDQLNLLSLRTPITRKHSSNQLQTNQLNNLQQPNFDNFSPTSPSQQQQLNQQQLPSQFQQPVLTQNQAFQSNDTVLTNNMNVDPNTMAAAVTAAAEATATESISSDIIIEEGTINPCQIFSNKLATSVSSPSLTTLFHNGKTQPNGIQPTVPHSQYQQHQQQQQLHNEEYQKGMISQAHAPKHMRSSSSPHFDFRPNDEFSNAINNWFNGPDDDGMKLFVNPSGILKNHTKSRTHSYSGSAMHSSRGASRRNSVQLLSNGNALVTNGLPHSSQNSPVLLATGHFENINEENDTTNNNKPAEQKKKRRKSSANLAMAENVPSIIPNGAQSNIPTTVPAPQPQPQTANTTATSILPDSPSISPTSTNTIKEEPPKKTPAAKSERKKSSGSVLTPNAQGAFPCNECDKQFKRSEHLKRHQRSVHSNDRPFPCKYCDKKFSRSDNLAQHLKTHTKLDANGNPTIVYGNTSNHGRRDKKKSA